MSNPKLTEIQLDKLRIINQHPQCLTDKEREELSLWVAPTDEYCSACGPRSPLHVLTDAGRAALAAARKVTP